MDIYDFDGTLYRGDSTADFLMWCVRRHPRSLSTLPRTGLAAAACFGVHAIDKTRFKAALYRFLPLIPDIEREVERFWATHAHNIAGPCHPQIGDVVISASPEFLLHLPCKSLGLQLIGSRVDPHTGRVLGPNCSGNQKIERLYELFPDAIINRFYSDSHNDDPLARLANEAWMVRHDQLHPWE